MSTNVTQIFRSSDKKTKVDYEAILKRAKKFVIDYYLPLAFLVAIIIALAWPVPGKFLSDIIVSALFLSDSMDLGQTVASGCMERETDEPLALTGLTHLTFSFLLELYRSLIMCTLFKKSTSS